MKKLLRFLSISLLAPCLITAAYAQATARALPPHPSDMKLSVELLSDTNGANIDSYMKNLISDLRKHWVPLVTEAAKQPLLKQQETLISFTIGSDGHIVAMQLEDSTHDSGLDKAAWNATITTSYLPPPTGMKGSNLKLRVRFVVD
jgi:TonB family protein